MTEDPVASGMVTPRHAGASSVIMPTAAVTDTARAHRRNGPAAADTAAE